MELQNYSRFLVQNAHPGTEPDRKTLQGTSWEAAKETWRMKRERGVEGKLHAGVRFVGGLERIWKGESL